MAKLQKQYDPDMIEDFLEHLLWDVRTAFHEDTHAPNALHPELCDNLRRFFKKYGAFLLPATDIDPTGVTEAEMEEVVQTCRQVLMERHRAWIEHLEALEGLFTTALENIRLCNSPEGQENLRRGRLPRVVIRAAELLQEDDSSGRTETEG